MLRFMFPVVGPWPVMLLLVLVVWPFTIAFGILGLFAKLLLFLLIMLMSPLLLLLRH